MSDLADKYLKIKFDDGSVWYISVKEIAKHKANRDRTTYESVIESFESDDLDIIDYAQMNMKWDECKAKISENANHADLWDAGLYTEWGITSG